QTRQGPGLDWPDVSLAASGRSPRAGSGAYRAPGPRPTAPPRSRRLSRGLRPRAPLLARLCPILSGLSRLRSTALCLALGRVDGAAASCWARGRSRGEGEPLAGGIAHL